MKRKFPSKRWCCPIMAAIYDNICIIIPSLHPDDKLLHLLKNLRDGGFSRIILVDDIYTTGTTLDEIAALLKEYGVSKVYCVTLACGSGV